MSNLIATHATNPSENNGTITVTVATNNAGYANNAYPYTVSINGVSGTAGPNNTFSWSNLTPGAYTVLLETTIPGNTCEFELIGSVLDQYQIPGCMDPLANNYDPSAEDDDGSCTYTTTCYQCGADGTVTVGVLSNNTIINTCNASAVWYELSLVESNFAGDWEGVPGTTPDNNTPCIEGCMDNTATNYDPNATWQGATVCIADPNGCTDPTADNYDPSATIDDASCTYSGIIYGNSPDNPGINVCQYATGFGAGMTTYPSLCNCCQTTPNGLIYYEVAPGIFGTVTCNSYGCAAP